MIKELAKCIGEYKKDTILSPLFVGLEVVMEVLIPLLMADLIDNGISAGAMDYIIKIGIVLVVMALISLLFGALSGAFAARAMAGFGKNLRGRMFRCIQDYSFGNIDRFSAAGLITRLTTDVTNVQGAFMMIIRIAVRAPLMLIMALICAFAINAGLSLVFLVAIPVLGIGLYYIMVKTFPVFMKVFKTYDNLNNDVEENLRAVRVVKAFVREKHETEKFNKVSGELYDYAVTAEKILALTNPLMMFVIYLCMLLIAWFGAHLIVSGSMTTGELVSMITYVMQILMSLMMLSLVFVMITMSRASALRIAEVLQDVPDVSNPKNPALEVKDGSIEFEDVSFGYSRDKTEVVDCLKHINFKIPSGATVGILGNTGSAKSSLVQLIPRLYDVSSGCVKVGGRDVREYDLKVLRDAVAMVLQNNVLFTGTVRGNLCWGNENATDEQIKEVCRIACIDKYIESLSLAYDSRVEQEGANFSGGQKQRLCIARALLKAPKVLIMDDSTSAVDMQTDAMIRKSFRESLPETTKLVIAQRVSSVEESDIIIVLDEGEILAMGTHDELMDSCVAYRETAISQMKGGE